MAVVLQVLASGFAAGAVYGLVAVGHSLVFRLTGVIHFAFGELIALGVFTTLLVATGSGPVSQTSVGGARFALALAVGLVVTAAASAGSYFLAIEPYRARGSVIGWVAASRRSSRRARGSTTRSSATLTRPGRAERRTSM